MLRTQDRATYREAARAFRRELRALFRRPEAAHEEFLYLLGCGGREYACDALRAKPYHFGPVIPEAEFEQHARTADAAYRYACERETRVRGVLRAGADSLRDADEALAWEWIVSDTRKTFRAAQSDMVRALAQRCATRAAVRAFRKTARKVFECPRTAVRAIYRHCEARGVDATVGMLDRVPQAFGDLRGLQVEAGLRWPSRPLLTWTTYAPARTTARTLGMMLKAVAATLAHTPSMRQVQEATAAVIEAERGLQAASAAADRHMRGPSAQLIANAVNLLGPLHWDKPVEVRRRLARQLAPMLSGSAAALIGRALITRHEWWLWTYNQA